MVTTRRGADRGRRRRSKASNHLFGWTSWSEPYSISFLPNVPSWSEKLPLDMPVAWREYDRSKYSSTRYVFPTRRRPYSTTNSAFSLARCESNLCRSSFRATGVMRPPPLDGCSHNRLYLGGARERRRCLVGRDDMNRFVTTTRSRGPIRWLAGRGRICWRLPPCVAGGLSTLLADALRLGRAHRRPASPEGVAGPGPATRGLCGPIVGLPALGKGVGMCC